MKNPCLTRLKLENFTVFRDLDIRFSPGINIFIGKNGTGKTHLLKLLYSACDITKTKENFAQKLVRVFLPHNRRLGRLVNRQPVSTRAKIRVNKENHYIRLGFSSHKKSAGKAPATRTKGWLEPAIECVYIPAKEMLANAPGFRSLYDRREIYFEEIYADILGRAYLPRLKGPVSKPRLKLLKLIQKLIQGKVVEKNEEFYLKNKQGNLEFTLLAEGIRKLALLWLLIQNGTLWKGSILFWDEPEANLNPAMMGTIVDILLELRKMGVQIFLATHNYVLLKEFDLRSSKADSLNFHALYHDEESSNLKVSSTNKYLDIHPNTIKDTFSDLYTRDVERALQMKETK